MLSRPTRPALQLSGGRGLTVVATEELTELAGRVDRLATAVLAACAAALDAARSPALIVSVPLAPLTAVRAERELLAAGALAVPAGELEGLALALATVAAGYVHADEAGRELTGAVDLTVGRALGTVFGPALLPVVTAAAIWAAVGDRSTAAPSLHRPPAARAVPGTSAGTVLLRLLRSPGGARLAQHLVAGVPGLLAGPQGPGVVQPSWAGAGGSGWPPRDSADVARLALVAALISPVFREPGPVQAVPVGAPRPGSPPRGLADLLALADGGGDGQRLVRVERLTGPEGPSWVVGIPGTRTWQRQPGADPYDLTTNLQTVAGRPSAVESGVLVALRQAGVRPGEPVMLVGHSQGGLVAARLARDVPASQLTITHVVTVGSPVAGIPPPPHVQLLSLEHEEDLVPTLDGAANPAAAQWLTARLPAPVPDPHQLVGYRRSAEVLDGMDAPQLTSWRAGAAAFLTARTATAQDVRLTRAQPADGPAAAGRSGPAEQHVAAGGQDQDEAPGHRR